MNYYNENDPKAAAWLRELIKAGHIPKGEVDERSIEDVSVTSLIGYNQHHFFAGIGGWSLALSLADWPADLPVWTGSCPCQPFSAAGKRKGTSDERHLWPTWHWLIKQYRPNCIFGEQVASKDGIAWLDTVSTDLEGEGYAVASVVLPACSVGAFHKRERLWFVGDSGGKRTGRDTGAILETEREARLRSIGHGALDASTTRELADTNGRNAGAERKQRSGEYGQLTQNSASCELDDSDGKRYDGRRIIGNGDENQIQALGSIEVDSTSGRSTPCDMADTASNGRFKRWTESNWRSVEWNRCKDGKHRPVKSGVFPLAHGVSGRVGLLRGYGNAIVPQVAAEVIRAYRELRGV